MRSTTGRQSSYEETLRKTISTAIDNEVYDFNTILLACESADPRIVNDIFTTELMQRGKSVTSSSRITKFSSAPLLNSMPAPDPALSQWFFTPKTITELTSLIKTRAIEFKNPSILCLGSPTIANSISNSLPTTLLDVDEDIIKAMPENRELLFSELFDVASILPEKFDQSFDISFVDPPWYENDIYLSINQSLKATKMGGYVFCTFPGRLTREGVERSLSQLIEKIVHSGNNVISIDPGCLLYQVPDFENAAFDDIGNFSGLPWRKGDLICIKKSAIKFIDLGENIEPLKFKSFARNPREFRVFINYQNSLSDGLVEVVENYSTNISTRAYLKKPDMWTTTKVGMHISDWKMIEHMLTDWESGASQLEATANLVNYGICSERDAKKLVKYIEDHCGLWNSHSAPPLFRTGNKIAEDHKNMLSKFATPNSNKIYKEQSDFYRPPFSRDRDRIIWSYSLKRLSDKTQLFPGKADDTVRRRLTHTLEVMQLASTIGASLGLNIDLIEASALAHDLGHTPFGHAGEHAIDKVFTSIDSDLGGFNHYEHGLDVVSYIESPYQYDPTKSFLGLNLSNEVLEAILKHTYFHDKGSISSIELQKKSKHSKIIPNGYCHLEGQAVRIADKISYFVSDIEDGLRIGAISIQDLYGCHFFHRHPIFFSEGSDQSPVEQFLMQRSAVIKILMEDVIKSSTRNLLNENITDLDSVRNANSFLVSYSPEINEDISQVWHNLQEGLLFNHKKVLSVSLFAAKVVSELLILFTLIPKLIESSFHHSYEKLKSSDYIEAYRKRAGSNISIKKELMTFVPFHLIIGMSYAAYTDISVPIENLIMAKDYVCSLSDYKARFLHTELLNDTIDT